MQFAVDFDNFNEVSMGRSSTYQPTVESTPALDIGALAKAGGLAPGAVVRAEWPSGLPCSIRVGTDSATVTFGGDWRGVEQVVGIERVRLKFGERPFWRCPRCWRRCSSLYLGSGLVCRVCRRLKHGSTREHEADRAHRAANKVRRKLGWEFGIANPRGGKPARMHWRTYERLVARHDAAAEAADANLLRFVQRLLGRFPGPK